MQPEETTCMIDSLTQAMSFQCSQSKFCNLHLQSYQMLILATTHSHTHTHTHTQYAHVYLNICVCVCVCKDRASLFFLIF